MAQKQAEKEKTVELTRREVVDYIFDKTKERRSAYHTGRVERWASKASKKDEFKPEKFGSKEELLEAMHQQYLRDTKVSREKDRTVRDKKYFEKEASVKVQRLPGGETGTRFSVLKRMHKEKYGSASEFEIGASKSKSGRWNGDVKIGKWGWALSLMPVTPINSKSRLLEGVDIERSIAQNLYAHASWFRGKFSPSLEYRAGVLSISLIPRFKFQFDPLWTGVSVFVSRLMENVNKYGWKGVFHALNPIGFAKDVYDSTVGSVWRTTKRLFNWVSAPFVRKNHEKIFSDEEIRRLRNKLSNNELPVSDLRELLNQKNLPATLRGNAKTQLDVNLMQNAEVSIFRWSITRRFASKTSIAKDEIRSNLEQAIKENKLEMSKTNPNLEVLKANLLYLSTKLYGWSNGPNHMELSPVVYDVHELADHIDLVQNFILPHYKVRENMPYSAIVAEQAYIQEMIGFAEGTENSEIHINPEVSDSGKLPSSDQFRENLYPAYAVLTLMRDIESDRRGIKTSLDLALTHRQSCYGIHARLPAEDENYERITVLLSKNDAIIAEKIEGDPKKAYSLLSSYAENGVGVLEPEDYEGEDDPKKMIEAFLNAKEKKEIKGTELENLVNCFEVVSTLYDELSKLPKKKDQKKKLETAEAFLQATVAYFEERNKLAKAEQSKETEVAETPK